MWQHVIQELWTITKVIVFCSVLALSWGIVAHTPTPNQALSQALTQPIPQTLMVRLLPAKSAYNANNS